MTNTTLTDIGCTEALRRLDACLDSQLTSGEMTILSAHMQTCPMCLTELELRRRLRDRLRSAVTTVPPSPFLETRVLATLRASERPSAWMQWRRGITTVAAMLVICAGTGAIGWQLGYLRFTAEARESYITKISLRVSNLMAVGLGNHVHCAVFGTVPKTMPKIEEIRNELPPEYQPLLRVVAPAIPSGYRLFTAHECRYHKRHFMHLTMQNGRELVSLMITRKQPGENFDARAVISGLASAGLPMYTGSVQRFEMAAFQTRDHVAYVVSDLPQAGNTKLMLAVAPAVVKFLRQMEG